MLTFVVKKNGAVVRRIVCNSREAFEEIRSKYFPEIPADKWVLV